MMRTRADTALLIATGLFVAGLALVAGSISFAHMRDLALQHDQLGWKALAFPISVDGLEVVASLYLVVSHRAGRPTGWVPWAALVVGTAASLAANVAVGGHDLLSRALAGWPAVSMLAAVKLLFSMFDQDNTEHDAVPDDRRTAADRPPVPPDGPGRPLTVGDGPGRPAVVPDRPGAVPDGSDWAGAGADEGIGRRRLEPADVRAVAHLVSAARSARAALAGHGRPLSRDALAHAMRDHGHGVSNERASLLLAILRTEERHAAQPDTEVSTIGASDRPRRQVDGLAAELGTSGRR